MLAREGDTSNLNFLSSLDIINLGKSGGASSGTGSGIISPLKVFLHSESISARILLG
jgi:hypothetical protein